MLGLSPLRIGESIKMSPSIFKYTGAPAKSDRFQLQFLVIFVFGNRYIVIWCHKTRRGKTCTSVEVTRRAALIEALYSERSSSENV